MISVKAFCEKYGMKPKTVYKRIAYNKNGKLAGHVTKEKGKPIVFDEFAENFLKSVWVKIDELGEEVIKTAKENDSLNDKVDELLFDNSELKSSLEKSKSEINGLKSELEKYKAEISELMADIEEKNNIILGRDSEIERLKSEVEAEKNKSIIEHLRRKGK